MHHARPSISEHGLEPLVRAEFLKLTRVKQRVTFRRLYRLGQKKNV